MKTRVYITSVFLPVGPLFIATAAAAQQQEEPQKFSLHTVRDVNGQEEVISKTFSSKAEMDAYMKENKMDMPEITGISTTDAMEHADTKGAQCKMMKTIIIETDGAEDMEKSGDGATGNASGAKIISINGDENVVQKVNGGGGEGVKIICIRTEDKQVLSKTGSAENDEKQLPQTGVEAVSSRLSDMRVYPNPNKGQFHIAFTLSQPGPVSLSITDEQGNEIYSEARNNYSGKFEKDIDTGAFANGIYSIVVRSGNEVRTGRIVKQ